MDERTANSGALDALYAELAKSTGVTIKQLRAWTAKTRFDADYVAILNKRVSCAAVANFCEPLIKRAGEMPEEGLLPHAYEALSAGLYPYSGSPRSNKGQKIALKVFLTVLSRLLDAERERAFDPLLDYLPVTEEELEKSPVKEQCVLFAEAMRRSYYRELLRIGKEIMPFDPAGHTFGVRHVAVHTARQAKCAGLPVDVALVACSSLSHDIGKFGCRGEDMPRIPYLHY